VIDGAVISEVHRVETEAWEKSIAGYFNLTVAQRFSHLPLYSYRSINEVFASSERALDDGTLEDVLHVIAWAVENGVAWNKFTPGPSGSGNNEQINAWRALWERFKYTRKTGSRTPPAIDTIMKVSVLQTDLQLAVLT